MRSVPEWIGKTDDQDVPIRVRKRVYDRAMGYCAISGRKIGSGELWQLDHTVPLWAGGEHRESNLRPVLAEAHAKKTAQEATGRAKEARLRARHLGLRRPTTFRGWRKFDGTLVWAKDRR